MRQLTTVLYFFVLSATAAGLLLTIGYLGYGQQPPIGGSEKMLVGSVFVAGCALSISLTFYPNWFKESVKHGVKKQASDEPRIPLRGYAGHHPDCDNFQNHRIAVGKGEFCSGCLGLMIGAAVSIVLMAAYMFFFHRSVRDSSSIFLAAGFGALFLTYVVSLPHERRPVFHVSANAIMVPAFSLVAIGILEMTGNLYSGLLVVVFSFLWIDTRIQLSHWRHSMTCRKCVGECKMY